jgi:hypothetical protein
VSPRLGAEARHYSRATSSFFTAAFQFVTIVSGGGDAAEAFVVLVRKRVGQSIQIRCYVCTKTSDVSGVILGEVDFLAGAQAKVDAMIAKAKERASKAAMRSKVAESPPLR